MSTRRLRGDDPAKTFLFHLVALENLPSVLREGGLWSLAEVDARGLGYANIGHRNIKDRRRRRPVPVAAGGVVADYVPFYLAPRSPMLFALASGAVGGYDGGQAGLVYLCSTLSRVLDLGTPWAVTDRHAELQLATYSDTPDAVAAEVDWPLMNATYWASTPEDPDRRERRQAEVLVHGFFPWSAVHFVGTRDEATVRRVRAVLDGAAHRPRVGLRPHWYFEELR